MKRGAPVAFAGGAAVGALGGLIGLGGAEFRLPLLIGVFRFAALEAVVLNRAMTLVVIASALSFRTSAVPLADVAEQWPIILNLLAGSLPGAWFGANWAARLAPHMLHRVIAVLLVAIAAALLFGHDPASSGALPAGAAQTAAGIAAGFAIGIVASLLGVAGGELLIPTLVLLFGMDIKLAGSVSLAVSVPTVVASFAGYRKDNSFAVLARNRAFALAMAAGSMVGALIGGLLLGWAPSGALPPLLAAVLVLSAIKVWRHR